MSPPHPAHPGVTLTPPTQRCHPLTPPTQRCHSHPTHPEVSHSLAPPTQRCHTSLHRPPRGVTFPSPAHPEVSHSLAPPTQRSHTHPRARRTLQTEAHCWRAHRWEGWSPPTSHCSSRSAAKAHNNSSTRLTWDRVHAGYTVESLSPAPPLTHPTPHLSHPSPIPPTYPNTDPALTSTTHPPTPPITHPSPTSHPQPSPTSPSPLTHLPVEEVLVRKFAASRGLAQQQHTLDALVHH